MGEASRRILLLAVLLQVGATPEHAPEPQGYWLGPIHGPVPATISGGTVIDTDALAALQQSGRAVLVDVAEAPRRPAGLPPGSPWVPLPHRDIPGSIWIPNAGLGVLPAPLDRFFRSRLAELTGHDDKRAVVIYCHPRCWMSWNAAKRAISYGYRHVLWYPDGIEAWEAAGRATMPARPEGPAGEG